MFSTLLYFHSVSFTYFLELLISPTWDFRPFTFGCGLMAAAALYATQTCERVYRWSRVGLPIWSIVYNALAFPSRRVIADDRRTIRRATISTLPSFVISSSLATMNVLRIPRTSLDHPARRYRTITQFCVLCSYAEIRIPCCYIYPIYSVCIVAVQALVQGPRSNYMSCFM